MRTKSLTLVLSYFAKITCICLSRQTTITRKCPPKMQFIQEHKVNSSIIEQFDDVLSQCSIPFEPSQVYDAKLDTKMIRHDLRSSQFRTLHHKQLFKLANSIVDDINRKQPKNSFKFAIHPNDVMHIKYEIGDYFKPHEDFLSLRSNFIEEYSLIVCLKGNEEDRELKLNNPGGKTILKINDFFTHESNASCTKGMCLLFRKDIEHSGETLYSGTKEILTFNVWAISSSTQQVVIVRFKNDARTYSICANKILNHPSGDLLKTFVNTPLGKSDVSALVLEYNSSHTYEEFAIVNDIYNSKCISYQVAVARPDILNYYLFNERHVLSKAINAAIIEATEPNDNSERSTFIQTKNYIVFGDESDYNVFLQKVKTERLPLIPFSVMFAEGSLTFAAGMSDCQPHTIRAMPVYASFSENENILFVRHIFAKNLSHYDIEFINDGEEAQSPIDFANMLRPDCRQKWHDMNSHEIFQLCTPDTVIVPHQIPCQLAYNYQMDEDTYSFGGSQIMLNLEVYFDSRERSDLLEIITTPDPIIHMRKSGHHNENDGEKYNEYYCITTSEKNCHSKLVLNPSHFEAVIKRISETELFDNIPTHLNDLIIPNAQRSFSQESEFYCNEQVYGTFNLIMLKGFLIMQEN